MRSFLLGITGLLMGFSTLVASEPSSLRVYLGTYTRGDSRGIYLTELDLESGTLSEPQLAGEARNPSFLALHPNGRWLYAVSEIPGDGETAGGAVVAFAVDAASGKLRQLNASSTRGAGPCHLVTSGNGQHVLAANYGGGSVVVLPVEAQGGVGPATDFEQHEGSSVTERQRGPHAHNVRLSPDNRYAFVADLGLDQVLCYRFDSERGTLEPNDPPAVDLAPGAGPRHFTFHPSGRFAYVINELQSTVTAMAYDAETGRLRTLQTSSTLPPDFQGNNSTAEVQVTPDGRFLYGSNRGHNSLAAFAIDSQTGKLRRVGNYATGGETPRNFGIDPTGKFILAANQGTNHVVVFRIADDGSLEATGSQIQVPSPVCVLFAARAQEPSN